MKHVSSLVTLLIASLAFGQGVAGGEPAVRTITVSGQAEVKVIPDRVTISLGVETVESKLEDAKREHDSRVKKLLALPAKFQIDAKDVQTDFLRIAIEYEWDSSGRQRQFKGYSVNQAIAITLKDISKYDALLSAAIEAGVNEVSGVDFQTSELRKHRDRARALAIQAAKEKATALSGLLGQRIGRPTNIQENASSWWYWSGSSVRGNVAMQNSVQEASPRDEPSMDGTIALGQVSVSATVSVTFELADERN